MKILLNDDEIHEKQLVLAAICVHSEDTLQNASRGRHETQVKQRRMGGTNAKLRCQSTHVGHHWWWFWSTRCHAVPCGAHTVPAPQVDLPHGLVKFSTFFFYTQTLWVIYFINMVCLRQYLYITYIKTWQIYHIPHLYGFYGKYFVVKYIDFAANGGEWKWRMGANEGEWGRMRFVFSARTGGTPCSHK